jgi:sugar O-acyltransferase (sialic acid O-acetyltransferase NeuD family)
LIEERVIILLGAGGHAAVVADAACCAGWRVAGCVDDRQGTGGPPPRVERLGSTGDLAAILDRFPEARIHAAVGSPRLRELWLALAPDRVAAPIVHPSAIVSTSARLAPGSFVAARAVVNPRASVGYGAIVNTASIVEHDCRIEAFAHLAPAAVLAGGASLGASALAGVGSIVLPGIRVGRGATLGAGSVAVRDVPDGAVAIGSPARLPGGQAEAYVPGSR